MIINKQKILEEFVDLNKTRTAGTAGTNKAKPKESRTFLGGTMADARKRSLENDLIAKEKYKDQRSANIKSGIGQAIGALAVGGGLVTAATLD